MPPPGASIESSSPSPPSAQRPNSADSAADNNGFRCISRPNRGKRASSEAEDNALGESSSNDDGINGSGKGDKKIERMEL